MQAPIEIALRHCAPAEQIRSEIDRQVKRLEEFGPRITSCDVVISGPRTRHRQGALYKVDLRIAMPGHHEVVVSKSHGDEPDREHALVAIRDAFDAAVRQIEDVAREARGQVKQHVMEGRGRVMKFLASEDCGFIEAPNGREIYFHRNAVLDEAFDRMVIGSEVRFAEEDGDKGAQASTVRLIGRRRPPSRRACRLGAPSRVRARHLSGV